MVQQFDSTVRIDERMSTNLPKMLTSLMGERRGLLNSFFPESIIDTALNSCRASSSQLDIVLPAIVILIDNHSGTESHSCATGLATRSDFSIWSLSQFDVVMGHAFSSIRSCWAGVFEFDVSAMKQYLLQYLEEQGLLNRTQKHQTLGRPCS